MRRAAPALIFVALMGCEEEKPLFAAVCQDGTRVAGTRDAVDRRCLRRGGVTAIAPLGAEAPTPANVSVAQ